jgi:hypothetical protein
LGQNSSWRSIFPPEQHDLYDGNFVISANRICIYMVGGLNDPEGRDHLDNEAKNVRPVSGTAEIEVNQIKNTEDGLARFAEDRLYDGTPLPHRHSDRHGDRGKAMSEVERSELAGRIAGESQDVIARATTDGTFVLSLTSTLATGHV